MGTDNIFEEEYSDHWLNKLPSVKTLLIILTLLVPVFGFIPVNDQTGLILPILLIGYYALSMVILIKKGVETALRLHYFNNKQTLNPQKPSHLPLILTGLYLSGCGIITTILVLSHL